MRSLWIASGLAFVLLTLAVALRPAPVADVTAALEEPIAPETLAADDLSQIMHLRAQFGSAADRFGGAEASRAAFEDQLLAVAGLSEKSPDPLTTDPAATSQVVLRQAAAELDSLANRAEEDGRYTEADELRSLGDKVRRLARPSADGEPKPVNADIPRGGL
ncbi:MAG TPA: hypothetical protein VMP01_25255 [Pirellulaceae bacterium]|nr:hypothetical protein [Pirellulaceae bacterium]